MLARRIAHPRRAAEPLVDLVLQLGGACGVERHPPVAAAFGAASAGARPIDDRFERGGKPEYGQIGT